MTCEQIAQLSPKKRELLFKRLTKAGTQIQPQPRDSNYFPLSFAQQRLWFLDQLVPGSFLYNENATLRLLFPLNVALLGESLNEIVRRHEALRTTFEVVDGQPVQVIAPALILPLPVVDLRELPELRRETEALRLATEEAQRPFDLARGPLMRTTLLRLGEHEYMFLLTMHHIVGDGWSMSVFSRELAAIYAAFSMGQPSPLPDLPIQYADFAVWQRQWLQGEVLETQLAYWKQQLADLPSLQLTHRSAPPGRPDLPGAPGRRRDFCILSCCLKGIEPARRGDAVHDPAGRVSGLAPPLYGPGRHRGGRPDGQPQPGGAGGADRVLRQHPGDAHRLWRATRVFGRCSGGCGRWRWGRMRIRTCPLNGWSKNCTPSAT